MSRNQLTIVWSAKGGTGVTTTTALIALCTKEQAVVTSFDTDLACVLGQSPDTPHGLTNWINSKANGDVQPLSQNGIGISNFVRFVPVGNPASPDTMPDCMPDADTIITAFKDVGCDVILDCGGLPLGTIKQLAAVADRSLLVVRACYLTLRKCTATGVRSTCVILVKEQGRALRTSDVEAALSKPITTEIQLSPEIARATDAGLLQTRHTRNLQTLDIQGVC